MTEPWIRPAAFAITFLTMFALETILPKRHRTESRVARTFNNLLLSLTNTLLTRFAPLLSAVFVATYAETNKIGLFHWWNAPSPIEFILTLIFFDLIIYGQHVAFHRFSLLWRVHQVHHADHDLDASSGLRFHPLEIAFSMVIKCLAVLLFGASPASVVVFEILLNSCAIFNHSNLKLPTWLDQLLRYILVTPDMHRVHHSIHRDETNSNFGFNIPWWDRIFWTYRAQPREPHEQMRLGIPELPESSQTVPIWAMLRIPFLNLSREKENGQHDSTITKSPPN